ncbi:hypothetical protein GCM10023238_12990 [Streptomyces heliomycini]
MSHIVVKRPPRALPKDVPTNEIVLQPPPELPRGQQEGALMQLLPMLGMGGSVVFFFNPQAQPFMKIMGMVMVASTIAMGVAMLVRYRRGNQGQLADLRRDYLRYLSQVRLTTQETAQAPARRPVLPAPFTEQLWALVAEGSRVWERRAGDADFGQVRVGLGPQALATPLVPPETAPVDQLEPLTAGAMQRFVATHSTLDALPMAISLRAFYHVTLSGDPKSVRGTARAVTASLAALHSPDDLVVAVATGRESAPEWEWAKWLPHAQCPTATDGAGSMRLVTTDPVELEELLSTRLQGRPRFHPGRAAGARAAAPGRRARRRLPAADVAAGESGGPAGRDRAGGRARQTSPPVVVTSPSSSTPGTCVWSRRTAWSTRARPRDSRTRRRRPWPGSSPPCAWRRAGTTTNRSCPTWSSPIC